jgi:hypothetical protein
VGDTEFIKVARKIQLVEAVQFSKPPQLWDIAQWMKAHRVDIDIVGCEFSYNFNNEKRVLYVQRNQWVVKEESGFYAYTERDFEKKFVIDKKGSLDDEPTLGD